MVKRVATLSIGAALLWLTGCQQQPTAGYGYPAPQPQYGYTQPQPQNSLLNPQYLQMAIGLAQQLLPMVLGGGNQYRPTYPQYPTQYPTQYQQYRAQPGQYQPQQPYTSPQQLQQQAQQLLQRQGAQLLQSATQPRGQSPQPQLSRGQSPTQPVVLDPATTQQLVGLFSALLGVQTPPSQPTQPKNSSTTTGKVLPQPK